MKAVLLCGGYGKRLRPRTNTIPKPLVPIAGRPLLDWQLTHLAAHGFTDIFMNLFQFPEKIEAFVGDGSQWGIRPHFTVEHEPHGTAGALTLFRASLTEPFLVLYSDVLNQIDLKRVFARHEESKSAVTVVVRRTDHPEDSDLVQMHATQVIARLFPKPHAGALPPGTFGNVGCYVMDPSVLAFLPKTIPSDIFQDFFPRLIRTHRMMAFVSHAFIQDVGTTERLEKVEARIQHDYLPHAIAH